MRVGILCFAATVLYSAVCPAIPPSQIIASTLGPGDSYGNIQTPIQNFPNGYYLDHAVRFQPTGTDFWFDSVRLPLYRQIDVSLPITLHLAVDAGGVPGADISSLFYNGGLPVDVPFQVETAPPTEIPWPSQKVLLHAGTPYWLYITASPGNNYDVQWFINSIGAKGNYAARGTGYADPIHWQSSSTFTTPAYAILGTPVPEPSGAVLALVAGGAMVTRRKRADSR